MKRFIIAAVLLFPVLASAQNVPPDKCNSDFARLYMVEHVAQYLNIAPEKVVAIATLGGAGGDGGHEGKPGDRDYKSELHCPIRVTIEGGGYQFMTYHELFSTVQGEKFKLTQFPSNPNDPTLKWIETKAR